jgi:hypothetical protein
MQHLATLWAAKAILADVAQNKGKYCDDGEIGAGEAADVVLGLLEPEPNELVKIQTKDGRSMDGIQLKRKLFRPRTGISLTPWQDRVYRAALTTAEIQLRRMYDSVEAYPDVFTV